MRLTPTERKRFSKLLLQWAQTYRVAGKQRVSKDLKALWSGMGAAYEVAGNEIAHGNKDWCVLRKP